MITFSTTIYKLGINPCVDVPESASKAFGIRGNIPVHGTINGQKFRSTLVPVGGGRHRLFVNTDMRQRADVDVNDLVTFELELDEESRELPMPAQLSLALRENPTAQEAWDKLTPSRQKEILTYLNWLKRPETLEINIKKTLTKLLDG